MKRFILICLVLFQLPRAIEAQELEQRYTAAPEDSLRVGPGSEDYLPLLSSGYSLMKPHQSEVKGVLIFLEDSGYEERNRSASQIYAHALESGYATISISTEIPFDFYFDDSSVMLADSLIKSAMAAYSLPSQNIFFIGVGLSGHRAMRYVQLMKEERIDSSLDVEGVVLCNSVLDWMSEWYKFDRELRIQRNDLWEPTFVNYMLESHLGGSPKDNPENYYAFSAWSYFDERNITTAFYRALSIRAYIEPAIEHWLKERTKSMYENNSPDMVGLLAELQILGSTQTSLVVIQPEANPSDIKNPFSTWEAVDKAELMDWIVQSEGAE